MTYDQVLAMEPNEMINTLTRTFLVKVPEMICTVEDMNDASKKLLKLASSYSYVSSLLSYVKIMTRQTKRTTSDKQIQEDMVDKKEIISNLAEAIKQQYSAISRAVTIHIENNHELKMQQF